MDGLSLPDLDKLDRETLVSLIRAQQERLDSLLAARDEELRRLEAELDSYRETLSQQADELRSRSERIDYLKLMVEKLRHMIFGAKSEKIVVKLEQLQLELEEEETTPSWKPLPNEWHRRRSASQERSVSIRIRNNRGRRPGHGWRFLKLIVPLRSPRGVKPAMSNVQGTQSSSVLVAIDIAKLRHDVLIEAPGWKRRKCLVLLNTAAEFRRLAEYWHSLQMPVHIAFEATGNYHRPLAHFLLSQGFHLELIPSLAVARRREAMHNSWDKNDPKDAQVLLHLLRTGGTERYHDPLANHTHDFQELSLTYAQISMERPGCSIAS